MEKWTLYVGLNDKDTKTQLIEELEAYKVVRNLLLNYTDGATVYSAMGLYKHEDGTFVTEKTFRIELLFVEKPTVKEIVSQLKILLNQESVAVQREVVESELW